MGEPDLEELDMDILKHKLRAATDALKYIEKACLCTRGCKGFGYSHDHKIMGKAGIAQRWVTPRDRAREALAIIEGK